MVLISVLMAIVAVVLGLYASLNWDFPTGPAIVVSASCLFFVSRFHCVCYLCSVCHGWCGFHLCFFFESRLPSVYYLCSVCHGLFVLSCLFFWSLIRSAYDILLVGGLQWWISEFARLKWVSMSNSQMVWAFMDRNYLKSSAISILLFVWRIGYQCRYDYWIYG